MCGVLDAYAGYEEYVAPMMQIVPLAHGAYTVEDNRALALASAEAQKTKKPLVVIYVISPQDYAAHDRGARRIDFMLRNLRDVKVTAHYTIPVSVTALT